MKPFAFTFLCMIVAAHVSAIAGEGGIFSDFGKFTPTAQATDSFPDFGAISAVPANSTAECQARLPSADGVDGVAWTGMMDRAPEPPSVEAATETPRTVLIAIKNQPEK